MSMNQIIDLFFWEKWVKSMWKSPREKYLKNSLRLILKRSLLLLLFSFSAVIWIWNENEMNLLKMEKWRRSKSFIEICSVKEKYLRKISMERKRHSFDFNQRIKKNSMSFFSFIYKSSFEEERKRFVGIRNSEIKFSWKGFFRKYFSRNLRFGRFDNYQIHLK